MATVKNLCTFILIFEVFIVTNTFAWQYGEPSNCTEKLIPPGTKADKRILILKEFLWNRYLRTSSSNICTLCKQCETDESKKLIKAIRNKELRVAVQNNIPPYVVFMNQGHSAQLTGYLGELWKMVEEAYDFRSVYQLINYSQGCEILLSGEADIMLSPVALTTSELDKYHFALTFTSSYYKLYVKNKGARANSHFYVYIWDSHLWYAFLGTLLIMSIFFWLISIFRKKNDLESVGLLSQSLHELAADLKVNLDPRATSLSLSNSFFCVLGAVTLQGVCMRPTAFSMRVVTVVCLLFGFLMYTAFSAVLVSRLAVLREDSPISSLEDLLSTREYSLCIRKNSNSFSLFKGDGGGVLPEWAGVLNAAPCRRDASEASEVLASLCKDNVVVMESNNIMNHHLATLANCSIIEVDTKYALASIAILVRKNLPYAKIISKYILKIYNVGLISLLKVRWGVKKQDTTSLGDTNVTLGHLYNIFIIYFLAIFLSLLILIMEIAVHRLNREKRRNDRERMAQRRNIVEMRERLQKERNQRIFNDH